MVLFFPSTDVMFTLITFNFARNLFVIKIFGENANEAHFLQNAYLRSDPACAQHERRKNCNK